MLNRLKLNHSKTNYMLFSPQKEYGKKFSSSINEQNIYRTAEAKYLGVYLDEKLKWDAHIQHLCKNFLNIVLYFVIFFRI